MSATWGEFLKITLFGQSHCDSIGCVIDGLPAGFIPDTEFIKNFMKRRAPSSFCDSMSTLRKEDDSFEIVSGLFDGAVCGAPLCAIIKNKDADSLSYGDKLSVPRPSHADYAAFSKYGDSYDFRGGGQFSGRLTAPLCFAGAIAKQLLSEKGITVDASLISTAGNIESAKENGDSVGGTVKCSAENVPAGIGSAYFGSLQSHIASLVFSVPGIKGLEFGKGFQLASMYGSEANDGLRFGPDGEVIFESNNSGGIQGGISNGNTIYFTAAFKPTPSISKPQDSVNVRSFTDETVEIKGRHDPCIALRGVPVIESCMALALCDYMLMEGKL